VLLEEEAEGGGGQVDSIVCSNPPAISVSLLLLLHRRCIVNDDNCRRGLGALRAKVERKRRSQPQLHLDVNYAQPEDLFPYCRPVTLLAVDRKKGQDSGRLPTLSIECCIVPVESFVASEPRIRNARTKPKPKPTPKPPAHPVHEGIALIRVRVSARLCARCPLPPPRIHGFLHTTQLIPAASFPPHSSLIYRTRTDPGFRLPFLFPSHNTLLGFLRRFTISSR
jgi:hypothetical protein